MSSWSQLQVLCCTVKVLQEQRHPSTMTVSYCYNNLQLLLLYFKCAGAAVKAAP
jgi:hypothetical protein